MKKPTFKTALKICKTNVRQIQKPNVNEKFVRQICPTNNLLYYNKLQKSGCFFVLYLATKSKSGPKITPISKSIFDFQKSQNHPHHNAKPYPDLLNLQTRKLPSRESKNAISNA